MVIISLKAFQCWMRFQQEIYIETVGITGQDNGDLKMVSLSRYI